MTRHDEARAVLRQCLRRCPHDVRHIVLSAMGHLYGRNGNDRRALVWYRRAIEAAPHEATG